MALSLAGRVYDENGSGLSGVGVSVRNEIDMEVASTTTGAEGSWNVSGLTSTVAHTVVLTLAGSQVRKIWGDIKAQASEFSVIDRLELASGGTLVLPDGTIVTAMLADGAATDAKLGNRTVDQDLAGSGSSGTLTQILSWLAGRIKAITGKANWYDAPDTTLAAAKAHADAAAPHSGHMVVPTMASTSTHGYTVPAWDYHVDVDASGGARTINLPSAADKVGKVIEIRKTDASTNPVTIAGNGSETINGEATFTLYSQYDSVTLRSDGSNVMVV